MHIYLVINILYMGNLQEETGKFIRMEEVTNDFVTYTYPRLEELGDTMNSIEPWPPEKRSSANGYQLVRHLIFYNIHNSDMFLKTKLSHLI